MTPPPGTTNTVQVPVVPDVAVKLTISPPQENNQGPTVAKAWAS
jgi:hypothetical protein